jgi:hypothetical protein
MEKGDLGWRLAGGAAAMVSGMVARKVITFAWKKATGKEPPDNTESPEVALTEALGWAIIMGVGMEVARVLTTRAVAKRWQKGTGSLPPALRKAET